MKVYPEDMILENVLALLEGREYSDWSPAMAAWGLWSKYAAEGLWS